MAAERYASGAPRNGGNTPILSRRTVLLASGAAVAAAAAGAVVASAVPGYFAGPATAPPAELVDALVAENALLAAFDAALGQDPSLSGALTALRADHVEHLGALRACVSSFTGPAPADHATTGSATPSAAPSAPTLSQLSALEGRASSAAAARAARLSGTSAVVLASIAACEASHAELLS